MAIGRWNIQKRTGKPELHGCSKVVPAIEMDPTPLSELPDNDKEPPTQLTAELVGDSILQATPFVRLAAIHRKPVAEGLTVADKSLLRQEPTGALVYIHCNDLGTCYSWGLTTY